ncbi:MAG: hydrogenase maturation protease [Coriobacteriales bacterium]|nr:hydrogenase maturation protease [Coriobacteriales bacterium]
MAKSYNSIMNNQFLSNNSRVSSIGEVQQGASDASETSIGIFCIGNMLMLDEGLGPRVAAELNASFAFPSNVQVLDAGTMGMSLLSEFKRFTDILVIDAVDKTGEPPGTVVTFLPEEIAPYQAFHGAHDTRFIDVLQASALMGHEVKGFCVGVQIANMSPEQFSIGLTPAVEDSLPLLLHTVLAYLKNKGITVVNKDTGCAWSGECVLATLRQSFLQNALTGTGMCNNSAGPLLEQDMRTLIAAKKIADPAHDDVFSHELLNKLKPECQIADSAHDDVSLQAGAALLQQEVAVDCCELPLVSLPALIMPAVWGPAHGLWAAIGFYPLWMLADNCFVAAIEYGGLAIVLAILVFAGMVAVTIFFARTSVKPAYRYAKARAERKGEELTIEKYRSREHKWAFISIAVAVVFIILATWYNLAVRIPGLYAGG